MIKHIPNTITAANLFMGCLSVTSSFEGDLNSAAWFIIAAAVLDFFDGFAARLLKVQGELGKQLDSLADVVSFGVAPGFIFYMISQDHLLFHGQNTWVGFVVISSYLPYLIPVFSALRLAKFNIDTRQTDSFIGVPTPANALFICSMAFVLHAGPHWAESFYTGFWFLILFPLISSYLLVSELPLFALKFKQFGFRGNEVRYIFIGLSILLLAAFGYFGIGLSIILYVLLSLFLHLKNRV